MQEEYGKSPRWGNRLRPRWGSQPGLAPSSGGSGRERLRQGGRKVEERRRREKVGGGVIGTRGTQPLVKRLTLKG